MLGIVVSRADSASVHIGEHLLELTDWEVFEDESRPDGEGGGTVYETAGAQMREFDALHLELDRPADAFCDPDFVVFASRHSGETGPLLTAHHTGNVGPADHGGRANELAEACPNAFVTVLDALEVYAPAGYDVGMECTHHGPSDVGAPSMFVEVGSDEPQWADPEAARAVARAILDLREVVPHRPPEGNHHIRRQLVGIGGGHYAPRFERVVRETDWAVGHILADWGLDALGDLDSTAGETVFEQAFDKSGATCALVDGDRPAVRTLIERLGYRAVGERWVRETDGVALDFVDRVESDVMTVGEGLRFGIPAREGGSPEQYRIRDLPKELLEETRAIDRETTYEALETTTLAFGTDQGGTRPTGPVVLESESDHDAVIDALVPVLETRYDRVHREKDVVVARQQVFNPEKASTLGIPEGPAFGRLAAGETVEVDGETIPPEVVHDEQTRRFELPP